MMNTESQSSETRQIRRQRERRMIKELSSLKYPRAKYRPVEKKGKDYTKFPHKPLTTPGTVDIINV